MASVADDVGWRGLGLSLYWVVSSEKVSWTFMVSDIRKAVSLECSVVVNLFKTSTCLYASPTLGKRT